MMEPVAVKIEITQIFNCFGFESIFPICSYAYTPLLFRVNLIYNLIEFFLTNYSKVVGRSLLINLSLYFIHSPDMPFRCLQDTNNDRSSHI